MAIIGKYDSNSINTLFASMSGTKVGNVMANYNYGVNLSDYSMIKSGTYSKLMKAYYNTEGTGAKNAQWVQENGKTDTSTSKDSVKKLASIEESASSLTEAAQKLYKSGSKTLFGQKDGAYDTDEIYDAVKSFVNGYNDLMESAGDSNTSKISKAADSMADTTKINAKALAKIGITVDSKDNTLSIDEDTFKKADMSSVKSLFNGNGSYAYSVATSASMMENYAKMEATKGNTYGNSGSYTYNFNTGQIYNDAW